MAFIFARHYLRPSAPFTLQRQPSYSLAITTYLPTIYLNLQRKGKSTHSQHLQWEEEERNHGDSNPRPSACYTSMLPLIHRDFPVVGAADSRSKLKGDRIQDTTICHGNELYFVKMHMLLTFYPIILFHHWLFSIFTFLPLTFCRFDF